MIKPNIYVFMMGKVVSTTKEYYSEHDENKVKNILIRDIPKRAGWVVGFKPLYTGVVRNYGDYLTGHAYALCNRKSIIAAYIVYWPTMKPVPVPIDAIEFTELEPHR